MKFVPTTEGFEGTIELRDMDFDARFAFLECLDLEGSDNIETQIRSLNHIKMLRKLVGASKEMYLSVDLTHKESGNKYSCFEDMSKDTKAHSVLIEVATFYMHGMTQDGGDQGKEHIPS